MLNFAEFYKYEIKKGCEFILDKAETLMNGEWMEVYPEYWIMSNSTDLSSYLYHTPINKVKLRCSECKEEVFICALGDGMKKKPYFAHKKSKESGEEEFIEECYLRTSNENYEEIYKFDKARANTYESALHTEMKKFAISKFWSKENKYYVTKEEEIFTYNRIEKTKLRADLLAGPLYRTDGKPIQRSEQYIFEGQTMKNPLSVAHIEKAIEYKKLGFLEENVINAYTVDHLKRATFISNNYIDILQLQSLDRTEVDDRIKTNREKRGSIVDMLEHSTVDKLSGYYAFHAETEFLLALKDYSNNHLLFMYIPITDGINELEEKNKHKRRLILASVLDTITIKDDYCVVAYLYFKDITYITDITVYQHEVILYKNKTIEFCQNSLRNVGKRYVEDIDNKNKQISDFIKDNANIQNSFNRVKYELETLKSQKESELASLKEENDKLSTTLSKTREELYKEAEDKVRNALETEYLSLEKLKSDYQASYDEIASVAERNIKKELENKYIDKYNALTDGHNYMRKRVNCQREHLQFITAVENIEDKRIDAKIKCLNISNDSLKGYFTDYLEFQISKCATCPKYK